MKIIKPHSLLSREVTVNDLDRVKKDAKEMARILADPKELGIHSGGLALAHSQVTNKDPLRFFVSSDGVVVINPTIIDHTKFEQHKKEGCLTYSWEGCSKFIPVPRWHKITVRLRVLQDDTWSDEHEETFAGLQSQVFQHEIDHFNGVNIYGRTGKDEPDYIEGANRLSRENN